VTKRPDFTGWRAALANPTAIGYGLPVHEDQPQHGYYRMKRDGLFVPVAIYPDGDGLVVEVDDHDVKADRQSYVWTACCRYPVSENTWKAVMAGGDWPDLDATVLSSLAGHNLGIDPAERLKDQVDSALHGVDAYKTIVDDDQQARAQSLRSRLLELSREADKAREGEKKPHLEAGKAVDRKWKPIVDGAASGANAIRAAMTAYENEKLAARRKIEAEAAAAARSPGLAPEPEPVETRVRGGYGRAAAVRTRLVVEEVTYPVDLFNWLRPLLPEVDALLVKLAQKALDEGAHAPPGITLKEVADVR